jgi:hypothetical protein
MRQSFTTFCQSLNIHASEVVHGFVSLCMAFNYITECISLNVQYIFIYQSSLWEFLYCWSFGPSNLQKRPNISSISLVFPGLGVLTQPLLHGGPKPH